MIKTASNFGHWGFKKIVKPFLFLFPPDPIHLVLVNTGVVIGKIAPARWLMGLLWRYDNPQMLAQNVSGNYFANPVGLSAGFDKNFQLLEIYPYLGFGFAECGSMSYGPSDGNPRPHYHRLKKSRSIVVNAGLNNRGSSILVKRIKEWQSTRRIWVPLNISVVKTNSPVSSTLESGAQEYIKCLKRIKGAKVGDMITINISCPNAYGGEPFTTHQSLEKLLKEVDKLDFKIPIFLKMPSDKPWPDFKQLIDVALKHNITGLTICNLNKNRHIKLKDPLSDDIKGSLSGKPVYDLSNELITKSYAYCGDKLTIIGVGGIFCAKDAYEKIKRGATLVELITGMIFEGPMLIGQINAGLVDLMQKDGYTHISQAIGAYHKQPKIKVY